jgi:hypothetical protein
MTFFKAVEGASAVVAMLVLIAAFLICLVGPLQQEDAPWWIFLITIPLAIVFLACSLMIAHAIAYS